MTTASGDSHHRPPLLRRHRCFLISLVVIVLLIVLILILYFTLFRFHDPTTELISARVDGVSPSISIPAIRISLNLSLFLQIRVHNRNPASFTHSAGTALLFYNGVQVGDALVEPGRIPSKGSEILSCELTVQADKIAGDLTKLIGDLAAGEVGFDSSTRVPGRVKFLGLFKHHAVALSECHVVIGFPNIKVKSQACTQQTKL
ncbi:LEA14-like protein [Dioscorea alata]|uniref:LEA14-like protein n=1 Tax=Dioscorea alata TaxID=55571 RepID=A0ACB7VEX1_DIOAL|nr:LEA14-like protein [Dioscorea alata]